MFELSVSNLQAMLWGEIPMAKPLGFSMQAGELIHLEGPNGSGKSTCMRMLLGLRPMDVGFIEWRHRASTADHVQHSAYMGHQLALDPLMTVQESLHRLTSMHPTLNWRSEDTQHWIDRFRLRSLLPVLIHQLSAGQRQSLAWCQLAVLNRSLWWLDEPFAHLDQAMQQVAAKVLLSHCEQGGAAMLISHLAVDGLRPTQRLCMEAMA